jgi:hypothetical protein
MVSQEICEQARFGSRNGLVAYRNTSASVFYNENQAKDRHRV